MLGLYIEPMVASCWSIVCDAGPTWSQHWINMLYLLGSIFPSSIHKTWTQCCFNVGTTSAALAQHWSTIRSMCFVWWVDVRSESSAVNLLNRPEQIQILWQLGANPEQYCSGWWPFSIDNHLDFPYFVVLWQITKNLPCHEQLQSLLRQYIFYGEDNAALVTGCSLLYINVLLGSCYGFTAIINNWLFQCEDRLILISRDRLWRIKWLHALKGLKLDSEVHQRNTTHWNNVVLALAQRLGQWPNIKTALI